MSKLLLGLGALAATCLLAAPAGGQNAPAPPPPSAVEMLQNHSNLSFVPESLRLSDPAVDSRFFFRRRPAERRDIIAGRWVRDARGYRLGRIESVGPEGAVIRLRGQARTIPLRAFAKDTQGLVLPITRARLLASTDAQRRSR